MSVNSNVEAKVISVNNSAEMKMQKLNRKFRVTGMSSALISALAYGLYTTLVLVAGNYEPLLGAELLALTFVSCGLNDLFAGIWLVAYNAKKGRIKEIKRSLKTFPGKMIILGALAGGPVANGAYLAGLAMAGAYAIPISATCSLFGALFAWIFLKQKPTIRVVFGMLICVLGAITINWVKPEDNPNFTLGIICALIAAVSWGLEGVIASYGGSMLDTDVAVNIRELVSGLFNLIIIVPLVSGLAILSGTITAGIPALILVVSGLCAAMSFLLWYKANSMVGCAIGMSLNVTYAFWGVFFCVLFLGQSVTPTIVAGSIIIVVGAILVTMNPLDFLKKKEV